MQNFHFDPSDHHFDDPSYRRPEPPDPRRPIDWVPIAFWIASGILCLVAAWSLYALVIA